MTNFNFAQTNPHGLESVGIDWQDEIERQMEAQEVMVAAAAPAVLKKCATYTTASAIR